MQNNHNKNSNRVLNQIPNYAFIDSQNLNLGIRSLGWKIDYKKLRLYLKNKYRVSKAFIFIGQVDGNEELYESLKSAGFQLIFKQTINYIIDGKETVKGNVDAELVLHASAIEFNNYNQAVLITGDGDFACLVEFLIQKDKLKQIIAPTKKYSQLLKPYSHKIIKASQIKKSIQLGGRTSSIKKKSTKTKNQPQRSVETLSLAGNGDNQILPKEPASSKPRRARDSRGSKKQT